MIAITLILALTGGFIAALALYWKMILEWIKKAVDKIKEVLGIAVQGTRTFIERVIDGFQNKAKYYNENKMTGEWEETVYTKKVDVSEIPPEILAKVSVKGLNIEVSTTEELRLVITA